MPTATIHRQFGLPLSCERISERRATRIAVYRPTPVNLDDEEETAAAVAWAADQAVRFLGVLDQRLRTRAQELRASLPGDAELGEDDERRETASALDR